MESIDQLKNAILNKLSIYDIIGETISLKDRSGLKVGLCPFHEENSPSFTVYPDHFFCFGCRERGDIINFVRKMQGLSFPDSLRLLAGKAGLDAAVLDRRDHSKKDRQSEAQLYKAMLAAHDIFKQNLHGPGGRKTMEYIKQRGFSEENIAKFGFGLAADSSTDLLERLKRLGFHARDIEACSLASTSAKNGKLYDFFRNRLMVPIHDQFGRLIAFGGRALDDYPPKYKNSRETRLFDKSQTLYGLDKAKEPIRKGKDAIVVEGYMDVLQLWQNEFTGAVACMGVALKLQHLKNLSHTCTKLYLLFDGDVAGQKANLGVVTAALEVPKLDIWVAKLPPGEDPDSYVLAHGPDAINDLLSQAVPLLDFAIQSKMANVPATGTPEMLKKELIPWVAKTKDNLKRSLLVNRLASLSGISRRDIEDELRHQMNIGYADNTPPIEQTEPPEQLKALTPLEYELLGHLFYSKPDEFTWDNILAFTYEHLDWDPTWNDMAEELIKSLKNDLPPEEANLSSFTFATDERSLRLTNNIKAKAAAFETDDRKSKIDRIVKEISLQKYILTRTSLKNEISNSGGEQIMSILTAIKDINSAIAKIEESLK